MSCVHFLVVRCSACGTYIPRVFLLWKAILEPYTYLVQAPGKDIRTTMILAFNSWLNVPGRKLLLISNVVSTLHNASLL